EPLLILRRFLLALIGRTRADQGYVGAKVLFVLSGLVARAVGAQAEVIGSDLVGRRLEPFTGVAAQAQRGKQRIGVPKPPILVPLIHVREDSRSLTAKR